MNKCLVLKIGLITINVTCWNDGHVYIARLIPINTLVLTRKGFQIGMDITRVAKLRLYLTRCRFISLNTGQHFFFNVYVFGQNWRNNCDDHRDDDDLPEKTFLSKPLFRRRPRTLELGFCLLLEGIEKMIAILKFGTILMEDHFNDLSISCWSK